MKPFLSLIAALALDIAVSGCSTHGKLLPSVFDQASKITPETVVVKAHPNNVVGANFELLPPDSPEIQAAMKEFEKTGKAPRIRRGGFLYVPYSGDQIILYCKPTRVCQIELARGEIPKKDGVFLGDSLRWWWGGGVHGGDDARVYSVMFQPKFSEDLDEIACDYSTNMIVQTNLRTYHFGLICSTKFSYTRVLRMYYPDEVKNAWDTALLEARASAKGEALAPTSLLPHISPEQLNYDDYRISGDKVAWRPLRAFDYEGKVYIRMPDALEYWEAPALFVRSEGKKLGLVNYRGPVEKYYIVDRLFDEAVLVLGKGFRQQKVRIQYHPKTARSLRPSARSSNPATPALATR